MHIIDSYKKYFYVVHACNDELRERAYRIRYEVYCREFRYEHEEDCPCQMERDEYDSQSMHCLLLHRPSGMTAGCVRFIRPHSHGPTSLLPFERCCSKAVDKRKFDLNTLNRDSFGEISRLAVLSTFRRRKSDGKSPISIPDRQKLVESGRDTFPLIPISLLLGMAAMLLNSGLKYGFAMMEPRLTRMLRYYGIVFKQIGNVVDYHGKRGPFVIASEELFPNLSSELLELMRVIDHELQSSLQSN